MADISTTEEVNSLSLGHFLTLKPSKTIRYAYQNFFIGEAFSYSGVHYNFIPFGFSGISVNTDGSASDASLIFPNNELSRQWADDAVKGAWYANVKVLLLNPEDKDDFGFLTEYSGRVDLGAWEESRVVLTLNTILNAVSNEIPRRRITQTLVGNLPTSTNVRLQ